MTVMPLLTSLMTKIVRCLDRNGLETENKVTAQRRTKFTTSQRTQFILFIQKTQSCLENNLYLLRKQNEVHEYIVNKTQSL